MSTKPAHNLHNKKWRSEDIKAEENISFSALLLSERILKGLKRAGFRKPSPVQLKAIPLGRCGVDLIVQAKSGTGKTCVFSIVALEGLADIPNLQALILAPTREVAHQICGVINSIGSTIPDLTCHMFIGGTSVTDDVHKLKNCQIAVGTPGRIKQLIEMKAMMTGCTRLLVLDEADRLISDNFVQDITWIYNHLPIRKQVLALSATYTESLMTLLKGYMRNPAIICINENELALKGLLQFYYVTEGHPLPHVTYQKKRDIIWEIVNKVSFSQCLIFCNTISRVELLCEWLNSQGYPTAKISSSDDQATRLQTIEELKLFQCRILVTSDLTARGIDAENVDFVINADLACNVETYLHRIGRAGRYGTKATAITIITTGFEEQKLGEFEKDGNFKVYPLPDPIPENLLSWTVEMVKSSKIEDSKQSIEELQKISFTGISEAKNKNGHVSDDDLKSDSSSSISDDETMEGEKENSQNNHSILASDEPVCKSSSANIASASKLNDNDVKEVLHAASSTSIEQENSLLHSESPDISHAAFVGISDSVESSSVKDSETRCEVMCSSHVTSSKIDSESNTGAGGVMLGSKDSDPQVENLVPFCAAAEQEGIDVVLLSEGSVRKTENNDLKTNTYNSVSASEVNNSLYEVSGNNFPESDMMFNRNSVLDLKVLCTKVQNSELNTSDNIEENSDTVLLTSKSVQNSDVGALQCFTCDAVYEASNDNTAVVCENDKASNYEDSVLDPELSSHSLSMVNDLNSPETKQEETDSFTSKNKAVSYDGCNYNELNKYVNHESIMSHNVASLHSNNCSEVLDSNISCDNIGKVLLSCCAEKNCKGKTFTSLINLPSSCFDLDRNKFEDKSYEQIVEFLETSHEDLEKSLSGKKLSCNFKKFSAEDLEIIQNYLHGSKLEYLSKIREAAALIDTTSASTEKDHDSNIEVTDAILHPSEEAKFQNIVMNQVENLQEERLVIESSKSSFSNVAVVEEAKSLNSVNQVENLQEEKLIIESSKSSFSNVAVSKAISESQGHDVKQQAVYDESSKSVCDLGKSDFEKAKKGKQSKIVENSTHVECVSDYVSASRAADSMLEAGNTAAENKDEETLPSVMPKVLGQISTEGDIPLDPKVEKRSLNIHNQQLSVKSVGGSKSCLTENYNKKEKHSKAFHEDNEITSQRHLYKHNKRLLDKRPVSNMKAYERETVNKSNKQAKLLKKKQNRYYDVKEPLPAVGQGQANERMHYQRYHDSLNYAEHRLSRSQYSNSCTNMHIHSVCRNNSQYCSCKEQKFVSAQKDECRYYERCNHNLPHAEYNVHNFQYANHNGSISMHAFNVNDCNRDHCMHSENHAFNNASCCLNSVECCEHHSCSAIYRHSCTPVREPCCHHSCGFYKSHCAVDSGVKLPSAILDTVYGGGYLFSFDGLHDLGRDLHEDWITSMSAEKQSFKTYHRHS